MKGRLVRKRVRIDTAGTGELGREAYLAVGKVIARGIPLLDVHIDGDRTEGHDVAPPQLVRGNVVHPRPLLGAVFVDGVEKDVVLLHDDSAFNLKGLDLISGCWVAGLLGYWVVPSNSATSNPATVTSKFGPPAPRPPLSRRRPRRSGRPHGARRSSGRDPAPIPRRAGRQA